MNLTLNITDTNLLHIQPCIGTTRLAYLDYNSFIIFNLIVSMILYTQLNRVFIGERLKLIRRLINIQLLVNIFMAAAQLFAFIQTFGP
jgi:uncharacterized protein YqhQ